MKDIGTGVREIRIRAADGAFRVIYVDVDLATRRYKALMKELKS